MKTIATILARAGAALVFSGAGAVAAAPAAPLEQAADYAYSLPLSVDKPGMVAFRLPPSVYLHARSAGLFDLRLFDASGAALPFALQKTPAQSRTTHSDLPVKVFPVAGSAPHTTQDGTEAGASGLDIGTGPDSRLLSVTNRAGIANNPADANRLSALVLDIGAGAATDPARPLIGALRFTLPAGSAPGYSARVWLEVSDDLKQWQPMATAELSWLVNRQAQTLANDRISFEPARFRYARLHWKQGEPVLFDSIVAEAVRQTEIAPATDKLLLDAHPGNLANDLVYQGAVAIPTEQLGLDFGEQNTVLPSQLGRYRLVQSGQLGQPGSWQFEPLVSSTFYRITQNGQQRSSGDLPIPITHNNQWVLRPQAGAAGMPRLRLVWTPANLLFLANGKGPYTLAFGREKAMPVTQSTATVAPGFGPQELLALHQAKAGALAVNPALATRPDDGAGSGMPARLRLAVLWGALLLGVAILGYFACCLIRQMNQEQDPPAA